MLDIVLASRYAVVFDARLVEPGHDPEVEPCAFFSEARRLAAQSTHPETPFGNHEAVILRDAHPLGLWGEHSCARYVDGQQMFP